MNREAGKSTMSLTELKKRYPEEWLLLVECKLSKNTELLGGKVVAHSRRRDDIYRKLKDYSGRVGVYFTGEIPEDLAVLF